MLSFEYLARTHPLNDVGFEICDAVGQLKNQRLLVELAFLEEQDMLLNDFIYKVKIT